MVDISEKLEEMGDVSCARISVNCWNGRTIKCCLSELSCSYAAVRPCRLSLRVFFSRSSCWQVSRDYVLDLMEGAKLSFWRGNGAHWLVNSQKSNATAPSIRNEGNESAGFPSRKVPPFGSRLFRGVACPTRLQSALRRPSVPCEADVLQKLIIGLRVGFDERRKAHFLEENLSNLALEIRLSRRLSCNVLSL